MEQLANIVESALLVEVGYDKSKWRVSSNGFQSCSVSNSKVEIMISVDPRDQQVMSSILFLSEPEATQDLLYTHVIRKVFDDDNEYPVHETRGPLEPVIKREFEIVFRVLRNVESNSVSARDLYYFQRGYNQAYNDQMSS